MPERVRTLFDDDGNRISKQEPNSSVPADVNPERSEQGKKRRRDGSLVSSKNTIAPPQSPPRTQHTPAAAAPVDKPRHIPRNEQEKSKPYQKQQREKPNGHRMKQDGKESNRNSLAERSKALLSVRKTLPIWAHQDSIRKCLRSSKDVMLLVGETGSGKSTQVPQFLLSEPWCKGCIAITQPRRVAAISLARRVAEEMGTPLGSSSPASRVGYSVRFDTSVSPSTKVKYLTEGMLLQEFLRDPTLQQYSAVIVDEVHERSVNVDLVLGFLRNIVTSDKKMRKGHPLKVVVMSATADTEGLTRFFEEGYHSAGIQSKPEKLDSNGTTVREDRESSWSGIQSSDEEAKKRKKTNTPKNNKGTSTSNGEGADGVQSATKDNQSSNLISACYIEGRQYPVKTVYLPDPTSDFVESALKCIFQIHYKEPLPGDILVFLTGQDTIESLEQLVNEYAAEMGPELPKVSSE